MTSEVFNIDCLEYMRTLPDKAFQLAIADPPYGINAPNMKMGFDYAGCELDKEYFDKGCERFDKECKGETRANNGRIIKQMSLFEEE